MEDLDSQDTISTGEPGMSQDTDELGTDTGRRWRRTAAIAGALAVSGVMLSVPASAAPAGKPSAAAVQSQKAAAGTPPAQVAQLDFLLGTLKCVYSDGIKLTSTDKLILGGTYVQMDMKSTNALGSTKINGRWILGWDALDSKFISYYYDDALDQGSEDSPGWSNGQITFAGPYVLAGLTSTLELQDVFTPTDANHFGIVESGMVQGSWKVLDTQTCVRTPTS